MTAPISPLQPIEPEGLLHVHTASHRGSYTHVLSQALRAAGLGSRVLIAQFLKGGVQQGPDHALHLCGRLQWLRPSVPGCLSDVEQDPAHSEAICNVWQICCQHLLAADMDQLVFDEVGLAVALGYLDEMEVLKALKHRPATVDVILTGPSIPPVLMDLADQVTELQRGF